MRVRGKKKSVSEVPRNEPLSRRSAVTGALGGEVFSCNWQIKDEFFSPEYKKVILEMAHSEARELQRKMTEVKGGAKPQATKEIEHSAHGMRCAHLKELESFHLCKEAECRSNLCDHKCHRVLRMYRFWTKSEKFNIECCLGCRQY